MLFDTPHSPGWRHPLVRAAMPGMTNRGRGYDPNQPRVPAGHPDGGQWTRIGGAAAPRSELPPGQAARPKRSYLPYVESAGATDAFAYAGQRILPLTDVDPDNGWLPELDYVASRSRGGPRYSPVEQLRIYQYNEALRSVRRYDPGYTEVSNPASVPSNADIARLTAKAEGLARTYSYFAARGISLSPHALRSISERPNRGITPETALRAYNTGRLFYDIARRYYIRRDSQTGVFVVITSPRGGRIISAAEGAISPRWNPVPYR